MRDPLHDRLRGLDAADDRRLGNARAWLQEWRQRSPAAVGPIALPPDEGAGPLVSALDAAVSHPGRTEAGRDRIYLDVFEPGRGEMDELRAESLEVLSRGAMELLGPRAAATDPATDPTNDVVDGLLQTAFGADALSAGLRAAVLGRRVLPDARPRLIDGERLQQLVIWGTINELLQALRAAGAAMAAHASWVGRSRAHADGISAIEPERACAGATARVIGAGFGAVAPANTTVRVPKRGGGCIEARVRQWADTEIVVELPKDVGIGCVGFLVTDGGPPADPLSLQNDARLAAGMLQSVLGDAFGPVGVLYGQTVVDAAGRFAPLSVAAPPCPPCLPGGANLLVGGPPVVKSFTVNGRSSVTVRPGAQLTLAWAVDGADGIRITGTATALPLPTGPLAGKGAVSLPPIDPEALYDWDADYVLAADNACTRTAPVTATVGVALREEPPLFGLADTHVHFLAHLAFGGHGIWGRPHPTDPALPGDSALAEALPHCTPAHGPGGVLPSLEGIGGHLVGGHPEFDGWPRHTTLAHQQAYVDWIQRAVDGGLRLAVCLAVNSELLGRRMTEIHGVRLGADDASAIDRQLAAMTAMVDFVDARSGGPGQGWMEIAGTPTDARRIVTAGRLALVPGVEVDSLGGWHTPAELQAAANAAGQSPAELIRALVAELYGKGVRHVFPVHATNNAFGGAALFVRNYDAANYLLTGSSFVVEQADQNLGIAYRLEQDEFDGNTLGLAERLAYYGLGGAFGPVPPQPTNWAAVPGGHINAQGLTEYGEILIRELMAHGMLVDVDHMGHKTFAAVLDLCDLHNYPVVSGHTSLRALRHGWRPTLPDPSATYSRATNAADFGTANGRALASEVDKSPEQIERIRRGGGLVSVFCYQRDIAAAGTPGGPPNDCAGSAKSFAQALLYVHERMRGRRLALGTDVNGAGQLPGPRFGPQGAAALQNEADQVVRRARGLPLRREQVFAQSGGVRYQTPIEDYRHHRFMDYGGSAPFDAEERDFWEAIAMWRSGVAPESAEQPTDLQRTAVTKNFIINLAYGLRAGSRAEIPIQIPFNRWRMPWPFYYEAADIQLAAFLASHAQFAQPTDPSRTRQLAPKLRQVWNHWAAMERGAATQGTEEWIQRRFGPTGSGLYAADGSLLRSRGGRRDFDVNIDGMAHYGLLPDFLQDVRNIGVPLQVADSLYRSAEDYIRVWERCLRHAPRNDLSRPVEQPDEAARSR
jgi:microsomal dipeptidase-like Zn-dependent dipeptidase